MIIALVAVLAGTLIAVERSAAEQAVLIREGFVFNGVEGTVTRTADGGRWVFESYEDAESGEEIVEAGRKFELLPCSTLEGITAGKKKDEAIKVKLWAKVTRYSNEYSLERLTAKEDKDKKIVLTNYLYSVFYLPIAYVDEKSEEDDSESKDEDVENEDSILPAEVLKKFRPKRVVPLTKKAIDVEGDLVVINRTGFAIIDKEKSQFSIDGLGQKVDGITFNLLPCDRLSRIEKNLNVASGRQRFKIAGTVTKYKDQYYVLLQRAVRTYNHGNFAR